MNPWPPVDSLGLVYSARRRCRHCAAPGQPFKWGLCKSCWETPAVAALYPAVAALYPAAPAAPRAPPARKPKKNPPESPKDGEKKKPKEYGLTPPKLPADRRCKDLPGTEGKIAELERRAMLGMELYHPLDAKGAEPGLAVGLFIEGRADREDE